MKTGRIRPVLPLVLVLAFCFADVLSFGRASKKTRDLNTAPADCEALLATQTGFDAIAMNAKIVASELSMENIRTHLEVLTGDRAGFVYHKLEDRYSSENKELVRIYLVKYLNDLGWDVYFEAFEGGLNFYIEIPGTSTPEEVFEVTAHYDTENDDVPGADDNGSGVGVLLELARIFKIHPPGKTMRLIFMDLEEQGSIGSIFHTQQVVEEFFREKSAKDKSPRRKFAGSLVIDTIGWNPSDKIAPHSLVLEVGEPSKFKTPSSLANSEGFHRALSAEEAHGMTLQCAHETCFQYLRFADATGARSGMKLIVDMENSKPTTGDHGSYWTAGLPAMFLAAPFDGTYTNPKYHTSDDQIRFMNWDYYSKTAAFAVETVAALVRPEVKLKSSKQLREVTEAARKSENSTVLRSETLLASLKSKPKPKVKEPKISSIEWHETDSMASRQLKRLREFIGGGEADEFVLAIAPQGKEASLVRFDGEASWLTSPEALAMFLVACEKQGVTVFKKNEGHIITGSDEEDIASWIMSRSTSGSKSLPPPPNFRLMKLNRGEGK